MGQQGPTRDLGPCMVVFGATELGETRGSTIFTYSQDTVAVQEDRYGTEPVDKIFTGTTCTVEASLTRNTLAELAAALPGSSGTGTVGNQLVMRSMVGTSQRDLAMALTLKPIVAGVVSTDSTEWIVVFRAAPECDLSLEYSVDGQRVYKVMFTGFRTNAAEVANIPAGAMWKIGSI